mmetsp:Transcript_103203/g.258752  ORF Transcript_103203/g.258752 Transcript_103203/m.258752 type:complete len:206 (+) Transcript_103203:400-1017(+)
MVFCHVRHHDGHPSRHGPLVLPGAEADRLRHQSQGLHVHGLGRPPRSGRAGAGGLRAIRPGGRRQRRGRPDLLLGGRLGDADLDGECHNFRASLESQWYGRNLTGQEAVIGSGPPPHPPARRAAVPRDLPVAEPRRSRGRGEPRRAPGVEGHREQHTCDGSGNDHAWDVHTNCLQYRRERNHQRFGEEVEFLRREARRNAGGHPP